MGVTITFLLEKARDLYDLKLSLAKEGHIIGGFVMAVENVRLEHFAHTVKTMLDFGMWLQGELRPFEILPIGGNPK